MAREVKLRSIVYLPEEQAVSEVPGGTGSNRKLTEKRNWLILHGENTERLERQNLQMKDVQQRHQ